MATPFNLVFQMPGADQPLQSQASASIPHDGARQFNRGFADRSDRLRVAIYAVPRDPSIYGPGVHDFYIRCLVAGCGAWSSPFTWMPGGADLRCRVCAERETAAKNFKVFVTGARFGCHIVKEVELDEPIQRSVVAGI
jgi:hypothetical protein